MRVGHGWDSSVFAGVENEGFEIYDFIFELNFLGFFVCLFLKKIYGNMNMFLKKK